MLKNRIKEDMIAAMKAGDKRRLGTVRLILAAIKQREVDERIELDDVNVLAVLDKMVKQRRDSIEQYENAGRKELADQESFEITVLKGYMPAALTEVEIDALIEQAIATTAASTLKDMGRVMAEIKPKAQGRADMGKISAKIRDRLAD